MASLSGLRAMLSIARAAKIETTEEVKQRLIFSYDYGDAAKLVTQEQLVWQLKGQIKERENATD